ncbi:MULTISPECIES: ORC1-type DNA replication protein [Methanosphaera]|uniref:ORC1-type DNA replication protein n=2 Tax=Methanosphaera stadtmanae TaxID=2317 RepID=Q2NGM0_METST|nr:MULTISPECIES: ORC1-type DNA replication protein [Methanosphaera]ABC57033.1 cell division control protein 6-like 2 [Methanosphaera stadtmanae DSM 3091]MEE0489107.1 ORC1-type DNA replication protein [Methanosphaera stadtmanae]OEC90583.1 AAA family ATPase [Methanosphaera sp. A6]RAP03314.1 AAA family ATPase [Methanosphaera stadtmanae]RAP47822.1 MAG: AAA family ATPase [Methanosphaera sp. DEW79]
MDLQDILLHDETIFKDVRVFNSDYLPEEFKLRQSQMEEMAFSLRPALHGGKPSNNILLGPPATGKTTAIKKLFEMAQLDCEDDIICVYVNCQLHSTKFGIFSQIYKKIFGHNPPETGVPFARIYNKIMNELYDTDKALIVALDDINHLFHGNIISQIFYDILRAHESYEGVRTGIFAVLSDVEFRFILDKNVGSIFNAAEINFKPYTYEETYNILKERVNLGFYPNVISNDLLEEITTYTFENGDLRLGIDLLRISGNNAEVRASRRIEYGDVEKAFKVSKSVSLRYILNSLSDKEKTLLRFITRMDKKNITSGQLYEEYNRENKIGYATYNRQINKLEFLRLIDTTYTGSGKKGNSRYINLRFDSKQIQENLPQQKRRSL